MNRKTNSDASKNRAVIAGYYCLRSHPLKKVSSRIEEIAMQAGKSQVASLRLAPIFAVAHRAHHSQE
ncbi:MAG: hypothetical protein IIA98_06115 [Proteobacteria bacterium]|nr:hypothetical protein [Pseudomonadota bacterium]